MAGKLADMSYGPGEAFDSAYPKPSLLSPPEHPPGLCITLTEREMERLDLDSPNDVGETIHLNVMAVVKSITKGENSCTVSAQITHIMVLENESAEGETPEDESAEDED